MINLNLDYLKKRNGVVMIRNLYLLSFYLIIIFSGLAAFKPVIKEKKVFTVEKKISVAIYKGNSYRSFVYKTTSAEIYLLVEKVNGFSREVVWDTTFDARILRVFPFKEKALNYDFNVQCQVEEGEHLEINYQITYNSKGSLLRMKSPNAIAGEFQNYEIVI